MIRKTQKQDMWNADEYVTGTRHGTEREVFLWIYIALFSRYGIWNITVSWESLKKKKMQEKFDQGLNILTSN